MQRSNVGASAGPGAGAPPNPPPGQGGSTSADDGDNRSRNAKAQRRHREKRKAHFKALEESVQVLTAQLEEARRQMGAAAYATGAYPGGSRLAYSPESKDVAQLAAEVQYLRDENAELRRQLYTMRVNYGRGEPGSAGGPLQPQSADSSKVNTGIWPEVKQEGSAPGYGVYSTQATIVSPPRMTSSSHGRTMSHPGDFDQAAEPGSTSSTSSYPPHLYQFGNTVVGDDKWTSQEAMGRHPPQRGSSSSSSRGRLMSSSSAPNTSPYVASAPFPTDPRAHALSTPNPGGGYPVRYESAVYPAVPPPHSLPRSAVGSAGSSGYAHAATTPVSAGPYVPRTDGDVAWGQESMQTAPASDPVYPVTGYETHEGGQGGQWSATPTPTTHTAPSQQH